jgi:hypothetical protein
MSQDKEAFLERWSRLKTEAREAKQAPPQAAPGAAQAPAKEEGAPPPLPRIEELTPESDFRPFMDARVDPDTRRAALKKLFADARFNVPDPFEAYSEDYTRGEPIPAELLKTLNQARKLLFDEAEKAAQAPSGQTPEPPAQEAKDGAGRQDA